MGANDKKDATFHPSHEATSKAVEDVAGWHDIELDPPKYGERITGGAANVDSLNALQHPQAQAPANDADERELKAHGLTGPKGDPQVWDLEKTKEDLMASLPPVYQFPPKQKPNHELGRSGKIVTGVVLAAIFLPVVALWWHWVAGVITGG